MYLSNDVLLELKEEIISSLDLSKHMSDEQVRELIDREILQQKRKLPLSPEERAKIRKDIFYALRRFGILQELLQDPQITEIMVNGTEPVFVEIGGKIKQLTLRFETEEKLKQVIQQMVSEANRVVNDASPIVDVRLKDGSRVNVVLSPVAINGPILTIRRFSQNAINEEQLIAMKTISREIADFLKRRWRKEVIF